MTANQINWFNANEQKRHNLATEEVSLGTLKESSRHNKSTEAISHESNLIQDWFNKQNAMHLHNMDAINAAHYMRSDSEQARHNMAVEGETNRHNEYTEYTDRYSQARSLSQKDRELGLKERQVAVQEQELPIKQAQADSAAINAFTRSQEVHLQEMANPARIESMKAETALKQQQQKYYSVKPIIESVDIFLRHYDNSLKNTSGLIETGTKVVKVLPKLIPLFTK